MRDIRPSICDIAASLRKDALVVITIEEGVLRLARLALILPRPTAAARTDTVSFQTSLLKDDDEPP